VCFEIGQRYYFEFDAIGCNGDHIHIFVGAEPKPFPSKVMQVIRSMTARRSSMNPLKLKKTFIEWELWSDGGYIRTVGEGASADIIKNYSNYSGYS